ncbi:hypothetical protein IT407_03780 [Candidatus Uhrbacteria bacterium]|nr:hypothetical protein [Candidatus Uhrbacteria bacterium]
MTAKLVAGRIGGLPVAGGHISLENADMAQVINATTGLVREVASTGAKLAGLGIGAAVLLKLAASAQEAAESKARNRAENPPRSMLGVCSVNQSGDAVVYGICLEKSITFGRRGTEYTASIDHVVSIERENSLFDPSGTARVELIDGSVFKDVKLNHSIRFLTLAGIYLWQKDFPRNIEGLSSKRTEAYKNKLIDGLKQTRVELLNEVGIDLVRKYFHIEDVAFEETAEPTLRIPAVSMPSPTPAHTAPIKESEKMPSAGIVGIILVAFALIGAVGGMLIYHLFQP